MRSGWSLAFGGAAAVVLLFACGGSSGVSIPNVTDSVDGSSVGTDGSNTDGTDPTDSGVVCAPCQTPPPNSSCTGTGPCGCAPYTCPPDGGEDLPDAGPDSGPPDNSCTWSANSNPCGPGKYCRAARGNNVKECGKGVCVAIGNNESPFKDTVCGCDGLTYWNDSVAAKNGMSIASDGACTGGDAQTCGGIASIKCTNGAKCNYRVQSENSCKDADASGTCWMVPSSCVSAVKGRTCGAQQGFCSSECTLIKAEEPWYSSNLCQP